MITEEEARKWRWIVERDASRERLAGFNTLTEAEAYIAGLEVLDAVGVSRGDYYIDGPCDWTQTKLVMIIEVPRKFPLEGATETILDFNAIQCDRIGTLTGAMVYRDGITEPQDFYSPHMGRLILQHPEYADCVPLKETL